MGWGIRYFTCLLYNSYNHETDNAAKLNLTLTHAVVLIRPASYLLIIRYVSGKFSIPDANSGDKNAPLIPLSIVRWRACLEELKIERIQITELFMYIYIPCLFIAQWCSSIMSVCNNSICFSNLCVQTVGCSYVRLKEPTFWKYALLVQEGLPFFNDGEEEKKETEILGLCSVRRLHGSVLFLIRNSHAFVTVRGTRLQKLLSSVTALACKQLSVASSLVLCLVRRLQAKGARPKRLRLAVRPQPVPLIITVEKCDF